MIKILKLLADTTSRNEKETILISAYDEGNHKLFKGFKMAYDYLITFGVGAKTVPAIISENDITECRWDDFIDLTDKLRARTLTGNAAKTALENFAQSCNWEEWNLFYRNIILKDMRCGVTDTTINKVLKTVKNNELMVDVFSCQLAKDAGDDDVARLHLRGKKLIDIKLDGVRILAFVDKDERKVTLYTRNGKQNTNFDQIENTLMGIIDMIPESVVLDGEVVGSSFQELMKQTNRMADVDTSDTKLAVFDAIPMNDFKAGVCKVKEKDRLPNFLKNQEAVDHINSIGNIFFLDKEEVDLDTKDGVERFKEINKQAVSGGYEGIMAKDPDAYYYRKRSFNWLKLKPYIEVSLEIVGFEEGEAGKANEGSLGALVCKGEYEGKQILVNVGSGFGEKTITRQEIWDNKQQYLGYIVEVKADALSLSEGSEIYSLRFPRFKGFRGNEPGELI